MSNKSKSYKTFLSRISYYSDDLEIVDILITAVKNGKLGTSESEYIFDDINSNKHKKLSKRTNSDHSRILVIQHLRSTLFNSYIKEIYEELTNYLKFLLLEAAKNEIDIGRYIGEQNFSLKFKQILELENWDKLIEKLTADMFQSLENERSTIQLIKKIDKKLGLDIDKDTIDKAIPYLELRHKLVHCDGLLNNEFQNKYPNIPHNSKNFVKLSFAQIEKARISITALVDEFDKKAEQKGFIEF